MSRYHAQRKATLLAAVAILALATIVGESEIGSNTAGTRLDMPTDLLANGFVAGPSRHVQVTHAATNPGKAQGHVTLSADVSVDNVSQQAFAVSQREFYLSAQGDALAHVTAFTGAMNGALVQPGGTTAGTLVFDIPAAAVPYVSLVDQPATGEAPLVVPLGKSVAGSSALVGANVLTNSSASATTNTIEDTFQRANQAGWGTSTNADGVANVAWGMDGSSLSSVSIASDTGMYGYPGNINQIGIASAGSASYNGGDSLVEFALSAVGHATPYTVQNACADKSCYYGARLHTSQNKLELAKRAAGGTGILASVAFTASANTLYWMRLQVTPGSAGGPTTLQAKIWAAGGSEPSGWMVSATDATPLASNLVGTGGSWDLSGTGESIAYHCYAYASSGLASACGASSPTPTPTPTATTTNTPTPTPTTTTTPTPTPAPTIKSIALSGGVGDPWGTATDASGNVWFAEPGCDFAPTCASTTPPGQIGELPSGSTTPKFWTLPKLTGNQPIFVTLDGSGNVWFTTPNNSMIGEFSPAKGRFIGQWAVTANSGPWDLSFNNGKIWYTEHLVSAIGKFDPSSHTYQDFRTPTSGSLPYGIVGVDPANANLVWFTENPDTVEKIGVVDTSTNVISEYSIRAQTLSGLTPHLITMDSKGNPWWSEGFASAIGTLNVSKASSSSCGVTTGDCAGVTEYTLGVGGSKCNSGTHISGITLSGGGVWATDSIAAQVDDLALSTKAVAYYALSSCGVHPHDGLNHDPAGDLWWDNEFANALGELTP